MSKQLLNTKSITRISILAAVSSILLFINFPIPFFPSFYKIDFSEIPCLLCGFALGPIPGLLCTVLSRLINILLEGGSETMFIGEFASTLIAIAFVIPSSIVYRKKHTKKGAMIALLVGIIISAVIAAIVNYSILLPMYETLMNVSLDVIISSVSKYFSIVNNKFTFVTFCTLPFNLIKGFINSLVVSLLYKRISPLLKDVLN